MLCGPAAMNRPGLRCFRRCTAQAIFPELLEFHSHIGVEPVFAQEPLFTTSNLTVLIHQEVQLHALASHLLRLFHFLVAPGFF